ncbi:MAG: Uma2 family endonuclease [Pegethrix bostrychoides GSE-TBD4-15B]|jgi:Uma2 family endonuclease|uniref:Uma2 family endonuclease n=1 Tax=Pegethrix bostrychoides GSE-TBD4-15B TaxID=2839662 RepID=A0A951U4I7_9CYAN|nr:Uma2 family endonuclease [Pegethrix bostrychoides GSE-TBD4-15B]
MNAVTVTLNPVIKLSDDAFYELCQQNHDLRFERTAQGELLIMAPVGGEGSSREASAIAQLWSWNKQAKLGVVFSSSGGFKLPNGADRSPDAAWIAQARWDALTPEQRRKFPPIAPDFVIEIRSASDDLKPLQAKMQEYLENGVRLGWLINPQDRQVELYRLGQETEVLQSPSSLSGESLLPGFRLELDDELFG